VNAQRSVLAIVGAALVILLYFFGKSTAPDKGKSVADTEKSISAPQPTLSFEEYEASRKAALNPSFASLLDNAKSDTALARIWYQFNSPALSAWYIFRHAETLNDAALLEEAGDLLIAAAKSPTDTAVSINCFNFALRSYEGARKLAPGDADLMIKLAETYVDGSSNPMQGIAMLRSLGDSLPEYLPAQVALGRFAVVSGQYQKAKERLDKVMKKEPGNTEAMYFLAFAEEGLGNKDKAIALMEQCKMLVKNPEFDKEINEYINSIKNK